MTRTTSTLLGLALLAPGFASFAGDSTPTPRRVVAADGPDRGAREPQLAVDARGRIFVAFGVGDSIRVAVSEDGGRTFSTSAVGTGGVLSLGMRRGPRVAVAGDSVVVSAVGRGPGEGTRRRHPRLAVARRRQDLEPGRPG